MAGIVNNPWPGLLVGVALVMLGGWLLGSHRRTWAHQQNDPTLDDRQRLYLYRRFRRRMQISSLLAFLGVLVGLGDALLSIPMHPLWPTLYWIGVLLLIAWIILLAIGDMFSTLAHGRAELARTQQKRQELGRQVVEFKHRPRENAEGNHDGDEA